MAILAGIDEAGYGPSLGPLVVSGAVFRVPDDDLDRCLWESLRTSCTKTVSRSDTRLAIADSKQLFRSRKSLAPLERAALVMLAVAGYRPTCWRELIDTVAPGACERLSSYPWYADAQRDLPLDGDVGDVGTRANAVKRDAIDGRVEFLGACSEPVLVGEYNERVRSTRNKAVLLLGVAMRVVDRILRRAAGERVRLYVDRLGGRTHYREPLATALPGADIHILEESPTRSAYRLTRSDQIVEVAFVTEGEQHHLPVALASVYSKYLRELHMHAFNQFWCKEVPDLRPTAGYYTDARRWLEDVAPAIDRLKIDRERLVRSR